MTPLGGVPQKLTLADVEAAQRIICICELSEPYVEKAKYETWRDVPAVSENYEKARDSILSKLKEMMK
jgi:hypothetical protein